MKRRRHEEGGTEVKALEEDKKTTDRQEEEQRERVFFVIFVVVTEGKIRGLLRGNKKKSMASFTPKERQNEVTEGKKKEPGEKKGDRHNKRQKERKG